MDEQMPLRAAAPAMAVRDVLAAERLRLSTLCETLRHDLDSIAEASVSSNADDEHDPEGATVAYERAQVAAVLSQSRSRLDEIDRALQRYVHGRYGICEKCGEPIPSERLAARPTAQTCLRCAG
jgi:RNA polymerase-binding transcription factor DksA